MKKIYLLATAFCFFFCSTSYAGSESSFNKSMKPVLKHYLKIQETLARDSVKGVHKEARNMLKAVKRVDARRVKGKNAEIYANIQSDIKKLTVKLMKSKSLKKIREGFKSLSEPMVAWTKISKQRGVSPMYCSMKRASWVQKSGSTKNPYYGSSMLGCGSKA